MRDWVWNTFVAPWPDVALGTLELRDVMNLALAAASVILAGYAIRMGRKQGQIAELQHRIMEAQLARRAALSLELGASGEPSQGYAARYPVRVVNGGSRSAADYYWEVLFPPGLLERSNVNLHNAILEPEPTVVDGVGYRVMQRHSTFPIYAGRAYDLGFIEVRSAAGHGTERLLWKLNCEDGQFPEGGMKYGTLFMSVPQPLVVPVDNS